MNRVTPVERAAVELLAQRESMRLCEAVRQLVREGARSTGVWWEAQRAAAESTAQKPGGG